MVRLMYKVLARYTVLGYDRTRACVFIVYTDLIGTQVQVSNFILLESVRGVTCHKGLIFSATGIAFIVCKLNDLC